MKKRAYMCGFHMYPKFCMNFFENLAWAVIREPPFNFIFKNI